MFLVDSTIWIDYFNGVASSHTDYLDRIMDRRLLLVGDLTPAEVLPGFRNDANFERA